MLFTSMEDMNQTKPPIGGTFFMKVSTFLSPQTILVHFLFLQKCTRGVTVNGRANLSSQLVPPFAQILMVSFEKHVDCCLLLEFPVLPW